MLFPGKTVANRGTAALIAGAMCAALTACSATPDFYVNPTVAPTSAASPTPSPTAHVFRIIPIENPPTPTPTPQPGVTLEHPDWLIARAMDKLRYRDSAEVRGHFFRTIYLNDETEASSSAGPTTEIVVSVEGEYQSQSYPQQPWPPFVDFHLRFHHELVAGRTDQTHVEPWDTEVQAKQQFVLKDTTNNNFHTHDTYADWYVNRGFDWDPNEMPNMTMFISLALTEDQIVEYELLTWIRFEPEQVRVISGLGQAGSEFWVLGATRTMPNGDLEEWTFWIDEDELPRRIELTLTNEADPARGVRGAVLEIPEIGNCLQFLPCRQ